nr:pyridoxal-phosphate dependent enzyme [Pseudomonas aeruginosa]
MHDLPTYDDVIAAAARIAGHANRTPVMSSRTLDEELGAEVFFKCENLQRMGAFKFRGAFNALSRFSAEQRAAGVVAFSSGNHAQAIALSARLLGIPATIVMPADAPAVKIEATRGYGGQVVLYDRYTEDREQIGRDLAQRHGLTLIPRMKLLVEPTGCLGLAAARQRKDELRGKRVGILLSGGNVDLARFCALLGG